MNILITGGNGFIGSAYKRAIEAKGHKCKVFDLPEDDILDRIKLRLAIKDVDMVVHFAAMADVTVCIKEQDKTFRINTEGTYNVGKICADYNTQMIYISTCCVYGNSLEESETEDYTVPQCAEPYAVSKWAGECLLHGIPNLQYAILRYGTVYGPGQREALFTHICLDAAINGKKIYIDGDGEQYRTLVYIDDLVDATVRASEGFDGIVGETLNICGVEKISAMDCVRAAEAATGNKITYEHRAQRYGQTFEENISVRKIGELLGWEPKTTFDQGMKQTIMLDDRYHGSRPA